MNQIIQFVMENKATIALALPFVGRAIYALKNGGGLIGMLKGLLYGTNVPKVESKPVVEVKP